MQKKPYLRIQLLCEQLSWGGLLSTSRQPMRLGVWQVGKAHTRSHSLGGREMLQAFWKSKSRVRRIPWKFVSDHSMPMRQFTSIMDWERLPNWWSWPRKFTEVDVLLPKKLGVNNTLNLVLETIQTHVTEPWPEYATQKDEQEMRYTTDLLVLSPYATLVQRTKIR